MKKSHLSLSVCVCVYVYVYVTVTMVTGTLRPLRVRFCALGTLIVAHVVALIPLPYKENHRIAVADAATHMPR